jgi:hypothetical protein
MREPHPLIGVRASSCAKGLRALRQTIEGIEWLGGERPALPDPHPRPCRDQGCSEVLPRVMAKFDMVCWKYYITKTFLHESSGIGGREAVAQG